MSLPALQLAYGDIHQGERPNNLCGKWEGVP